jgi:hypothetical protein
MEVGASEARAVRRIRAAERSAARSSWGVAARPGPVTAREVETGNFAHDVRETRRFSESDSLSRYPHCWLTMENRVQHELSQDRKLSVFVILISNFTYHFPTEHTRISCSKWHLCLGKGRSGWQNGTLRTNRSREPRYAYISGISV